MRTVSTTLQCCSLALNLPKEKPHVDLTYNVQNFSINLNRKATLKDGVKRKELHQYLSPSLLKREGKCSGSVSENETHGRKRLSDGSVGTENKKPRISLCKKTTKSVQ